MALVGIVAKESFEGKCLVLDVYRELLPNARGSTGKNMKMEMGIVGGREGGVNILILNGR